jgi:hypothetical protein
MKCSISPYMQRGNYHACHRTAAVSVLDAIFLVGPATAADLTGAELKTLLSGKSVYLENTATSAAGAGQGVLYYAVDGSALYKTGSMSAV